MSIFGKIMGAIFGTSADAATPAGTTAAGSSPAGAPGQGIDVAAILDKAVAAKKEQLAWRTSIVDLMKALDLDSSPAARKELAKELKYAGDSGRFGVDECLAAQAGTEQARCERRQGTGGSAGLKRTRSASRNQIPPEK